MSDSDNDSIPDFYDSTPNGDFDRDEQIERDRVEENLELDEYLLGRNKPNNNEEGKVAVRRNRNSRPFEFNLGIVAGMIAAGAFIGVLSIFLSGAPLLYAGLGALGLAILVNEVIPDIKEKIAPAKGNRGAGVTTNAAERTPQFQQNISPEHTPSSSHYQDQIRSNRSSSNRHR